jgi:hypothetical protein
MGSEVKRSIFKLLRPGRRWSPTAAHDLGLVVAAKRLSIVRVAGELSMVISLPKTAGLQQVPS